jgi:hypothetical protein
MVEVEIDLCAIDESATLETPRFAGFRPMPREAKIGISSHKLQLDSDSKLS